MSDGQIIRVARRRRYTSINNDALEDKRLSWKARGLLGFLLSRPDDWRVNIQGLIDQAPDGRAVVRSGLRELEDRGYLVRTRHRLPDGTFEWHSVLYEEPQPQADFRTMEEQSSPAPQSSYPPAVNPRTENRTNEQTLSDQSLSEQVFTSSSESTAVPSGAGAAEKLEPRTALKRRAQLLVEAFERGSGLSPAHPYEKAKWFAAGEQLAKLQQATPEAVEAAAKRQREQWADRGYARNPGSLYRNWTTFHRSPTRSSDTRRVAEHEPWMDLNRLPAGTLTGTGA